MIKRDSDGFSTVVLGNSFIGCSLIVYHACGFRNERYLCAVYKKATGRTPGQQRRQDSTISGGVQQIAHSDARMP